MQALQDLELEVDHRPEIFGAIERLTRRSFEVIVADLDDGPEAAFLLKTARELQLNKSAFVLAMASGAVELVTGENNADLILTKPILSDQVKYALLNCDGFLVCMRNWLAWADSTPTLKTAVRPMVEESPQLHLPVESENSRPVTRPAGPSPTPGHALPRSPARIPAPLKPAMAVLERKSPVRAAKPDTRHARSGRAETSRRPSKFLWATALAVAVITSVYAFSSRLEVENVFAWVTAASSRVLGRTYDLTAQITRGVPPGPDSAPSQDSAVVDTASVSTPPTTRKGPSSTVPWSPARHIAPADQTPSASPGALPAKASPALDHRAEVVTVSSKHIPESIRLPQFEAATVRDGAPRLAPVLLGELQPVTLSEDTSDQLLLEKVQPGYPEQALRAGIQGAVVLQAWIGTDGNIRELKLVRGSLLLGQAAYQAVKQWRYKPYLRDGRAVEAQTFVTVNFKLPQQSLVPAYPR